MKFSCALLVLLLCIPAAQAADKFTVSMIKTFASPDSSYETLINFIESANSSLYINVYTFESASIAERLINAWNRGVKIILIVEKAPVGGITEEENAVLHTLSSAGMEVYYHAGEVRFNHAKYAIADNLSVLITTENFKDSGFPKYNFGSRGWGIIAYDAELAKWFLDLFYSDLRSSEKALTKNFSLGFKPQKKGRIKFKSEKYQGNFPTVAFAAPEDGITPVLNLINSANKSLFVEQDYAYAYWGPRKSGSPATYPNLFLEAAIDAARRGAEVKILLDSSYYNIKLEDPVSNYHTIRYVNEIAKKENLKLEAKLMEKRANLEKLHTKGVVVDGSAVLVSSINWNEHSPTKNREVGVIVYGEPAGYFAEIFMCDWSIFYCYRKEMAFAGGVLIIIIIIKRKKLISVF